MPRKMTTNRRVAQWPALTFHYGLSPIEIMRMPGWLRREYVEALPKLLAQKRLYAIEAATSVWMKPDVFNALVAQLTETLDLPEDQMSPDQHLAIVAASGIGVKVVSADGR
jgi:hypothetical protein